MKKLLSRVLLLFIFIFCYSPVGHSVTVLTTALGCGGLETFVGIKGTVDFTEAQSGMTAVQNGAKVSSWLTVWCSIMPNGDSLDSSQEASHQLSAKVQVISPSSSGQITLSGPPGAQSALPIKVCLGNKDGKESYDTVCTTNYNQLSTLIIDSGGASKSFGDSTFAQHYDENNNLICPRKDPKQKDCDGFKFGFINYTQQYQAKIYIILLPLSNAAVALKPGVYSNTFQLQISGRLRVPLPIFWQNVDILDANDQPVLSGPLTFQATILKECQIKQQPQDIDFGQALQPAMYQTKQSGSFKIQCTQDTPFSVKFVGSNDKNNNNQHYMKNGSSQIGYQFYDSAGTNVWDNDLQQTADGTIQTISYKVGIVQGQDEVAAGDYSDTVYAEITY